jgi:hypothetical protein
MSFFLSLAILVAADGPKEAPKDVPANLKGTWKIMGGTTGKNSFTSGVANCALKIGDGSAEWNFIPIFSEKAEKAKFAAEGKGDEGTLELKVGDKLYKGIYRLSKIKDAKLTTLRVLLGLPGKPAPKAFSKDSLTLPADASLYLFCQKE